jgi:UDP-N-acetylglucosamine--N-acetylmuramyl-(pentapeptide) pyrophosphoryl-undecaprenol N-acetylglucosamine transferase
MVSCVLMCTTNGVGLGHLTRTMAIARRLHADVQPVIFTLSQAVPLVRRQGFPTEFLFSAGYAGTDRGDWQLLYERRLDELIATYDPAVVTFDGTHPYVGVFRAMRRHPHRAFVWCRRAMWKPGLGHDSIRRAGMFDHVIEPGELAASADRGATVADRARAQRVDPVVMYDGDELVGRDASRAALGLDPAGQWVLVQLGAGAVNDLSSPLARTLDHLRRAGDLRVAYAESPIGATRADLPPDVTRIRSYPLLPHLRAFDFVVTAAGYNSYHETVAAGVPALFVPNVHTQADDQVARARYAADAGFGTCWEEGGRVDLRDALDPLLDARSRSSMRAAAQAAHPGNGAHEAAASLTRLAGAEAA